MSNIAALRNRIQTQFMSNGIISAREAKEIVDTLGKDGLNVEEKQALEQIRADFKDGFSRSGMRAFDRALNRLPVQPSTTGSTGSTGSLLDLQLGRSMDKVPTSFELSEVRDTNVRDALSRLDLNSDGFVNKRDQQILGFSDQQWQAFAFGALMLGAKIKDDAQIPTDLTGKKVCFTAVPDWNKMTKWAEAMGAEITTKVTPDVDFLFVGDSTRTGKDERALALNTMGEADIQVTKLGGFLQAAKAAGVTGPAQPDISRDAYDKIVDDTLRSFYEGHIRDGYEYEMSNASPSERTELRAAMKNDLDNFDPSMINPDEYFYDMILDNYGANEPYVDRFGVPVPLDSIDVLCFDFFSDLDGIGLSKTFVFDRRNGNLIDEGDLQD